MCKVRQFVGKINCLAVQLSSL